jgi:YfiR/HmsC-like
VLLSVPNSLCTTLRRSARALLICAAIAGGGARADNNAVISEAQIKAAFLYNFTKFVEWPDGTFESKGDPIDIGVLGDPALAAMLESIVAGRRVNGHAIVVKVLRSADEIAPLEMLFVSETEEAQFAALPDSIRDRATLTVGETPAFATAGGAIVFGQHDGKLRFTINMSAPDRARLRISAELQKLAIAVTRLQ